MKTAVVYYSLEGNCTLIAQELKKILNADLFEIKTVDSKKRSGFSKYFWGGRQVVMHKKPAIQPLDINIASYDLIVLGAPVWAASPAPPLLSFLETANIHGKKLALFCCHAGGMGKALEKIKAQLSGNTIAGQIDFCNPAKANGGGIPEKLAEWVKNFS